MCPSAFSAPTILPAAPSPRASSQSRSHRVTSRCSASTRSWAAPSIRTTPHPASTLKSSSAMGSGSANLAPTRNSRQSLRLDNDVYHVVGVMPASFRDQGQTSEQRSTDLWAAAGFYGDPAPPPMRGTRFPFETIARLQPGLSPEAAQGHLDALVASLKKQYPADYPSQGAWTLHLTPLAETIVGNVRRIAHSAVRRGRPGPADQLRQRRQSAACSHQRARTRIGGSPGIGSRKNAPHSSASSTGACCSSCLAASPVSRFSSAPGNSCCNLFPKACRASTTYPSAGACWRLPSSSPSPPEPSWACPRLAHKPPRFDHDAPAGGAWLQRFPAALALAPCSGHWSISPFPWC